MSDLATYSIAKLTLPISMVTTIIGGSAWLTSTRSDVNYLQEKVNIHVIEFKESLKMQHRQGEIVSKMDGKLDLVLSQLRLIERRLNRKE